MPESEDQFLRVGEIMDSQLETRDGCKISRVADIEAEWLEDGSLVLTSMLTGPQALAGRVSHRLRPIFRFVLRDRFEHSIPLSDVEKFGPTLRLCGVADDYAVGQSEHWIVKYILRWIPGNGH